MLWKHTVVNCAQTLRSFKEICRVSPWFFRGWGLCYVRGLKLSIAQTRVVWLTLSTSFSQSSNPHPSPFTTTIPRLPHMDCAALQPYTFCNGHYVCLRLRLYHCFWTSRVSMIQILTDGSCLAQMAGTSESWKRGELATIDGKSTGSWHELALVPRWAQAICLVWSGSYSNSNIWAVWSLILAKWSKKMKSYPIV